MGSGEYMYLLTAFLRRCQPLCAISLVVLSACATKAGLDHPGTSGTVPPEALTASVDGFNLRVGAGSLAYGGSLRSLSLETEEGPDEVVVRVSVDDARKLKALYFDLDYDLQQFTPTAADASDALGGGELLELAVLRDAGTVHHGQVQVKPQDQAGFSGDAVLAEVRFARRPNTETRIASAAPLLKGSKTRVDYNLKANVLVWKYANQGDYDQNGEVNIADLTPLAVRFGDKSGGTPAFPDGTIEFIVDGDGNGEIGIADITPIGQNFGRIVLGYRLHRSADPGTDYPAGNADPGTTAWFKTILLADATGAPTLERLTFSFTVGAVTPGEWFWVRPGHGTSEGTPSNMVEVEAVGDGTPIAALTADVTSGPAPLDVSFDASGSSDADGTIANYSWDFNGDGTPDLDSGTDATVIRNYPGDGTFEAAVTVTDDDGLAAAASLTIVVGSGVNELPVAALEA
jgi:hypothetical protein